VLATFLRRQLFLYFDQFGATHASQTPIRGPGSAAAPVRGMTYDILPLHLASIRRPYILLIHIRNAVCRARVLSVTYMPLSQPPSFLSPPPPLSVSSLPPSPSPAASTLCLPLSFPALSIGAGAAYFVQCCRSLSISSPCSTSCNSTSCDTTLRKGRFSRATRPSRPYGGYNIESNYR
jgi:hypothetical protein